jgi:hypothetical protein
MPDATLHPAASPRPSDVKSPGTRWRDRLARWACRLLGRAPAGADLDQRLDCRRPVLEGEVLPPLGLADVNADDGSEADVVVLLRAANAAPRRPTTKPLRVRP